MSLMFWENTDMVSIALIYITKRMHFSVGPHKPEAFLLGSGKKKSLSSYYQIPFWPMLRDSALILLLYLTSKEF